jgi:ankyrin repeat protein
MSNEHLEELFLEYPGNKDSIIESLEKIIAIGDVDINHICDGWAPIHYAVHHRDGSLLKFLCENKADLKVLTQDGEKRNILHLTFSKPNIDTITVGEDEERREEIEAENQFYLFFNEIVPDIEKEIWNVKDISGFTPLEYFAKNGNYKLCNFNFIDVPAAISDDEDAYNAHCDRIIDFESVIIRMYKDNGILDQCLKSAFENYNYFFIEKVAKHYLDEVSPYLFLLGKRREELGWGHYSVESLIAPQMENPLYDPAQPDHPVYRSRFISSAMPSIGTHNMAAYHELIMKRSLELELIKKIQEGDNFYVESLLAAYYVSVRCLGEDGRNCLEYAALSKNIEACGLLVCLGINQAPELCPSFHALEYDEKRKVSIVANYYKKNHLSQLADNLASKTTSVNRAGYSERIRRLYRELLAIDGVKKPDWFYEKELYAPVARLCAIDDDLEIHMDETRGSVDYLHPSKSNPSGLTLPSVSEIYVGMLGKNNFIKANLIHEMTHFACQKVWKNGARPYFDGSEEEKVIKAIALRLSKELAELDPILKDAIETYPKEKWSNELIARVPDIIMNYGHETGLEILTKQAPDLLDFYRQKFIPRVRLCIEADKEEYIKRKWHKREYTDLQTQTDFLELKKDDSSVLLKKSTLAIAGAGAVLVGGAVGYALAKSGRSDKCTVQ